MARRTRDMEEPDSGGTSVPPVADDEQSRETRDRPANTAPPATDFVIVVNLTRGPLPLHLANGRTENLGPKVQGRDIHRSKPILRKLLTPLIRGWERKRMLAFEPAQEVCDGSR